MIRPATPEERIRLAYAKLYPAAAAKCSFELIWRLLKIHVPTGVTIAEFLVTELAEAEKERDRLRTQLVEAEMINNELSRLFEVLEEGINAQPFDPQYGFISGINITCTEADVVNRAIAMLAKAEAERDELRRQMVNSTLWTEKAIGELFQRADPSPEPAPPEPLEVCDTTMTRRLPKSHCKGCGTYPANLGPCETWEAFIVGERCPYCDHGKECHPVPAPPAEDLTFAGEYLGINREGYKAAEPAGAPVSDEAAQPQVMIVCKVDPRPHLRQPTCVSPKLVESAVPSPIARIMCDVEKRVRVVYPDARCVDRIPGLDDIAAFVFEIRAGADEGKSVGLGATPIAAWIDATTSGYFASKYAEAQKSAAPEPPPQCAGYPTCDGNLPGEPHSQSCPAAAPAQPEGPAQALQDLEKIYLEQIEHFHQDVKVYGTRDAVKILVIEIDKAATRAERERCARLCETHCEIADDTVPFRYMADMIRNDK